MPRKSSSNSSASTDSAPVDSIPATKNEPTDTPSPDKPVDVVPDTKPDTGSGVDDDSWKYSYSEPEYLDRARRLREEVNINGSGGRSDSLADSVGQIAKGLGYTKGVDARQDVIGRESVKGKVSDGDRAIDFKIQVDRQLDPVRFNPTNWDKADKFKRGKNPVNDVDRNGKRSF